MTASSSPVSPSTGAVVRFRERLWRIDRVMDNQVFAATPLDGRDTTSRLFATALEDLREARMPFPEAGSAGTFATQQMLLDAFRVSLIHGTAPIQGLQRSRAVPTEFQLVPLLKVLGKERARLLIADDVGTGKTVEAGLVLAELMARGLVRRVLVAVPANLREQWAEALEHFFHLNATIIAGHLLPALERQLLPGQSPWEAYDVVVASIDYLKKRPEHVFAHPWDLVIIDEAHLAARPHQLQPSESDMLRWQFAQRAAAEATHLLLLTATPHNGYRDSYASLFELIDPSLVTVSSQGDHVIHRERAKDHVVQRRRTDIEAWYRDHGRRSPFPEVDQDEIIIDPGPALDHMLNAVAAYSKRLYEDQDVRHINGWIAAHLQKRALSSPEALRKSLRTRMATLRKRSAVEATTAALRDAREHVADSLAGEDASDEERSTQVDVAASTLDANAELELLDAALEAAEAVTPAQDAKLQRLFEVLAGTPRAPGGRLSAHPDRRRVIVFTRFKDTLDYIVKGLEREAKKKQRTAIPADLKIFAIYGDMTLKQRMETFAEFERTEPAVLVATDCISEGLNLQARCAELIHYEIPYNPNRLAQRNGRISRYGQPEPFVGIRLLVLDNVLDRALMELIVEKARRMYEDYGYVPDFLANPDILYYLSQVGSHAQLLRQPSLWDAAEEMDGADLILRDPFDPETMDTIVQEAFYGQEGVNLGRVQDALDETRAAVGGRAELERFLDRGLAFYGLRRDSTDGGRTWVVSGRHADFDDVLGDEEQRYTLDPEVGMTDPDVDIVDLSHRLVRRLVDLTLERANLPDCEGRIASLETRDVQLVTGLVTVLARYVAQGEPPVLLEELVPVAVPVYGNGEVPDGKDLLHPNEILGPARTTLEVVEAAATVLARPDLEDRIGGAIEQRRQAIAEAHREIAAPWSKGLDRVELASWDLVAVTVLYPGGTG